jgi:geranylgeranylglycerol-phosphate geranylgeranyltransferase
MSRRRALEAASGLLQMTRPLTCLGTALLTLAGALLAAGGGSLAGGAWRAALVVGLIAAACDVLNDVRDVPVDRVNRPTRPLPAGRDSARLAIVWMTLLAVAAAALAASLGPALWATALLLAALGAGYSLYFKNTVLAGNAVVGFLCGIAVVYGAWVQSAPTLASALIGLCVAVFVFAREILGTVADAAGDARTGLATITTRWGKAAALRAFTLAAAVFIALCALPWLLGLASTGYLAAAGVVAVLPMSGIALALRWRADERAIHTARWVMKLQWFAGLLAIAFLR